MADVLSLAGSYLGQGPSHFTSFCGNPGGAWCASFVSTIMHEAGESAAIGGNKFTSVSDVRDYYNNLGQYFNLAQQDYTPQPGDLVIWKHGDGTRAGQAYEKRFNSHVGFVESVDSSAGKMTIVDGNWGGKVSRHTENISTATGFCQPHYGQAPVGGGNYSAAGGIGGSDVSGGEQYTGGISTGIGLYDFSETHTVASGETLESIAQKYDISLDLLLSYNGLDRWSTVEPGDVLVIPKRPEGTDPTYENTDQSVERGHTASVKVYHPVIKVEFYTEGGALAVTADTLNASVYGDPGMDFDVISCTTQRSMSSDCPSMTVMLTNRRDWFNILSPNDLIIVKMQRPEFGADKDLHEPEQEVFIGAIDDVRKSLDFTSGMPKRVIQVTARGLGKAFVNFSVGLIKNITADLSVGFMGTNAHESADGGTTTDSTLMQMATMNSAQAIRTVWDTYVGNVIRYSFYNGKTLKDYVEYDETEHPFEILADFKSYTQYTGSLWNFIKELNNAPFNETFWEIRDGKAVLTHRPTPFNPEEWNGLNRRIIRDDDIVTDATGRSDLETYTVFIVNQRVLGEDISKFYNPIWYKPYYEKYGISQLEVTTTYAVTPSAANDSAADTGAISPDDGTLDTAAETTSESATSASEAEQNGMRFFLENIFNWNIKNNKFANGQIVVKGRASYKIGERVVLEYNGLEFYVEGVSHNFTVYGGWMTTLSVTRGILPEDRFTPPWGQAQEMTTDTMHKILQLTSGEEVDWTKVEMGNEFTNIDPTLYGNASGTPGVGSDGFVGPAVPISTSGGYNSAGKWVGTRATAGQTVMVPDGIGTVFPLEKWSLNDSPGADSTLLRQQSGGKYDAQGFSIVDGRYAIAVTPKFGQVGDYLDVRLKGGQVLHCIMGDTKGPDCGSEWGHVYGNEVSVVEFCVNDDRKWSGNGGSKQPWNELPFLRPNEVVSITNGGNWWTIHGKPIPY